MDECSTPLQQTVPLQSEAFQRVLEDNIEACRAAGYVNKTRIFEFLREVIRTHKEDAPPPDDVAAQVASSLSMHHAPQFVDDRKDGENGANEIKVRLCKLPSLNYVLLVHYLLCETFLSCNWLISL